MPHLDFILLIYMGSHDLLHGFHVFFFSKQWCSWCLFFMSILQAVVIMRNYSDQILDVALGFKWLRNCRNPKENNFQEKFWKLLSYLSRTLYVIKIIITFRVELSLFTQRSQSGGSCKKIDVFLDLWRKNSDLRKCCLLSKPQHNHDSTRP